jgi:DNA-binding NtrC family response regulator
LELEHYGLRLFGNVVNEPIDHTAVRILLAEDHLLVRKLLAKALTSAGYDVIVAEDGDKARWLLENGAVADVLLSDIRMPGSMDGFQLARWVQHHRPAMAILLQTAYSDLDTGAFRVLRKPFSPEELATAIRELLSA